MAGGMGEMVIDYDTLALSQQVIERHEGHAHRVAAYLAAHADVGDSTGLLLSVFDPLSRLAVRVGSDAARALGELEQAMAGAVGDTQMDVADQDGRVGDAFTKLFGRLGADGADDHYPELTNGPALPAAGQSAPGGYGDVESFFWQKGEATAEALGGGIEDLQRLVHDLGQWGSTQQVSELVDASSYLVAPQAPDEPGLRTCAGARVRCSAASTGSPRSSSASRSSTAASSTRSPVTGRASSRPPRPGTTPAMPRRG